MIAKATTDMRASIGKNMARRLTMNPSIYFFPLQKYVAFSQSHVF